MEMSQVNVLSQIQWGLIEEPDVSNQLPLTRKNLSLTILRLPDLILAFQGGCVSVAQRK